MFVFASEREKENSRKISKAFLLGDVLIVHRVELERINKGYSDTKEHQGAAESNRGAEKAADKHATDRGEAPDRERRERGSGERRYNKMLKTPKPVAPSALTPSKNIHCDGAHHSAGRGPQGRGAEA